MWIEITTEVPCPVRCWYCPQDVLEQAYKGEPTLTLDTLEKCLQNVSTDVGIHFSGFSEPFTNYLALDLMEMVAEKGFKITVYSTLVGLFDIERFKKIPVEFLRVHDVGVGIPACFSKIASPVKNVISRAGNLMDVPERDVSRCCRSHDLTANVMLPNGDVYLCCQDYGLTKKLGNLLTDRFESLDRGMTTLCRKCEYGVA